MSIPKTAEVVIVGGGVLGASAAYHLTEKGCRNVVLIERDNLFGTETTAKCAGGVRYHFGTEINIRLSLLSLPMFDRFEEELGQPIDLRRCGYLFVLTREADVDEFKNQMRLQLSLGVRTEWLAPEEVRRRLSVMEFPDALAGLWGPDDGIADPNGVVQGYVAGAARLGAVCLTDTEATGIEIAGNRVAGVRTTRGDISCPTVLNAAGPWAAEIGRMAGIEIPVAPTRRQLFISTPIPSLPADFPFVFDFARSLYFHREGPGVLSGMSNPSQGPGLDQSIDETWELNHLEAAAARMPALENAGIANHWAGLYEITPDAHPILGAVRGLAGFYCATGFSGHGFMHGPGAGLLLAEEIVDGAATSVDISSLNLSRFEQGRLLHEYSVV